MLFVSNPLSCLTRLHHQNANAPTAGYMMPCNAVYVGVSLVFKTQPTLIALWDARCSLMCCVLTLERIDQLVSVFDQLFDKLVGSVQLDFMAFESFSEVRTVQKRVTELQSRQTHDDEICSEVLTVNAKQTVFSESLADPVHHHYHPHHDAWKFFCESFSSLSSLPRKLSWS